MRSHIVCHELSATFKYVVISVRNRYFSTSLCMEIVCKSHRMSAMSKCPIDDVSGMSWYVIDDFLYQNGDMLFGHEDKWNNVLCSCEGLDLFDDRVGLCDIVLREQIKLCSEELLFFRREVWHDVANHSVDVVVREGHGWGIGGKRVLNGIKRV